MRALIQRVSRAQAYEMGGVRSSSNSTASIGAGMFILAGFEDSDGLVSIEQMVQKIKSLRIFSDENGKMNLSGNEVSAQYLITSQFTLYADCKYGNRPSFDKAAKKIKAKELYEHFVKTFSRVLPAEQVCHTPFGSDLSIELVNEGPVTLWLDSHDVL